MTPNVCGHFITQLARVNVMPPAISVRELSKRYYRPTGGFWRRGEPFLALKNISFDVSQGEVFGVIGQNGAGKSTLLKILSQITEPTGGEAILRGRVGALLEVGTGFHRELTGRENIYLNGAILGMKRAEINAKLDAIVDFSGVSDFIDTPLKHYSSGMEVRLAFAVAAHLEPEILLIDEVLSVGDAEFRRKSLDKMREVTAAGRTVLFVSHNILAIEALCDRVLLLKRGEMVTIDTPSHANEVYMGGITQRQGERLWQTPFGNDGVGLTAVRLLNASQVVSDRFYDDEPIMVELDFVVTKPTEQVLYAGIHLHRDEVRVLSSHEFDSHEQSVRTAGRYMVRCVIPAWLLNQGDYTITAQLKSFPRRVYSRAYHAVAFSVSYRQPRGGMMHGFPGVVAPRLAWTSDE